MDDPHWRPRSQVCLSLAGRRFAAALGNQALSRQNPHWLCRC
ncbi:rCG20520 [Rattus norvegicus]|uniref:RCG20520 n=1 Tax=Rattus norvegicus TaxID=10116 RepID=A6K5J7_RAT|nr:rCG20520 [Rattus norvegicus]